MMMMNMMIGGHGFKPPGGQILTKLILCCVTSDLSDNLTEMRQTGRSRSTTAYVEWWKGKISTGLCLSVHKREGVPFSHWSLVSAPWSFPRGGESGTCSLVPAPFWGRERGSTPSPVTGPVWGRGASQVIGQVSPPAGQYQDRIRRGWYASCGRTWRTFFQTFLYLHVHRCTCILSPWTFLRKFSSQMSDSC